MYDRADAAFYDYYSTGLEGDVAFYVEEAQKAGAPVLELGCGTGRTLIPVAQSGIEIVGLDRAPAMLAICRDKIAKLSPETQRRIDILEGDMRDFSLARRFKLVTIPYRAFLHLLTVEDQRSALRCIHDHLEDDGRLILNIFDPRLDIITAHLGPLGSAVKKLDEFTHPDTGRHVLVSDTRTYTPESQLIEQCWIFEELDDQGTVVAKRYTPMTLRYVYRYEMQHLLELCGYAVEALYGDFQRGPFRYGGEQIWVARKT
ncbi:MAG TPA: class I SAM-dependent methyltransferase [Candidatus Hydrogenedentes bacterium]|nr:class I SAM-dependent methyltransferase [Candidatus Hydrogenedentota bacterium]HIJ74841.1 class I SAM-dependent methyltransferase [Candidatus Hydrogenedentota bacterium]